MEQLPVAEILPGLYRAVLDAVAELEARNRRADAAVIRAEATNVYSRAWTEDAARRLRALRIRADRIGEAQTRSRDGAALDTPGRQARQNADMERRPA